MIHRLSRPNTRRGIDLHQDRDGALFSDGGKPLNDALLRAGAREEARDETQPPLSAGLLGALELGNALLDVLRGGAGDDGVVFEAGAVEGLPHAGQDLGALLVRQVDGLARAAEDDEPLDARLGQVD